MIPFRTHPTRVFSWRKCQCNPPKKEHVLSYGADKIRQGFQKIIICPLPRTLVHTFSYYIYIYACCMCINNILDITQKTRTHWQHEERSVYVTFLCLKWHREFGWICPCISLNKNNIKLRNPFEAIWFFPDSKFIGHFWYLHDIPKSPFSRISPWQHIKDIRVFCLPQKKVPQAAKKNHTTRTQPLKHFDQGSFQDAHCDLKAEVWGSEWASLILNNSSLSASWRNINSQVRCIS